MCEVATTADEGYKKQGNAWWILRGMKEVENE